VHHRILYFVARSPGTTVTALLGVLGVSKQALNGPPAPVGGGGPGGHRHRHPRQAQQHLSLTEAGAALEAELSGTQMALLEEVFTAAGPDAEQAWRVLMGKLCKPGEARVRESLVRSNSSCFPRLSSPGQTQTQC
jgi:DNA-binding MarR family transcriptional regulator